MTSARAAVLARPPVQPPACSGQEGGHGEKREQRRRGVGVAAPGYSLRAHAIGAPIGYGMTPRGACTTAAAAARVDGARSVRSIVLDSGWRRWKRGRDRHDSRPRLSVRRSCISAATGAGQPARRAQSGRPRRLRACARASPGAADGAWRTPRRWHMIGRGGTRRVTISNPARANVET